MENLNYPRMKYLINTLTVKDFGYYVSTDPDTGAVPHMLVLKGKGKGMQIPWVAGLTTLKNDVTKAGAFKSVLVAVNAPAPCAMCHYEYELNVHRKWQQPGVMNDDYYPATKSFGGVIEAIQTPSGGYMADSDKIIMEDNIITQIESDQAVFRSTREPNIVHAKRLYTFSTANAVTDSLTYIVAGVSTTIALGASLAATINALNSDATFSASLVAFAIDATHIAVTSVNPGLIFYIADGGGVTTIGAITRYMWIYAKYTDPKFYIDFPQFGWATVTPFNLAVVANTATGAGSIKIAIGGTSNTIVTAAASSTIATNINAGTLGVAGSVFAMAKTTGNRKDIYVYSGANELKFNLLDAYTTISAGYSGKGVWPALTWKQVFNEFLNAQGMDKLSNFVVLGQPSVDSLWNKITIEYNPATSALNGASHRDNYNMRVAVYIQQGLGSTNLWYGTDYMTESVTDNANFVANATINGLLDAWSGLTHGTDYVAVV